MAFDRTNPVDLLALKNEESLDPIGMGYVAVSGQTKKTLDLFNLAENNVGTTPEDFIGEVFTSEVAMDVIDPTEITVGPKFSEGQARWLEYLFSAADSLGTNFSKFEAKFRDLFAGYAPTSTTLTNLDARNRKLSRVERLFDIGTVISREDWFAARDYQG